MAESDTTCPLDNEAEIRGAVRAGWHGNRVLIVLAYPEGPAREIAEDEWHREAVRRCCARRPW